MSAGSSISPPEESVPGSSKSGTDALGKSSPPEGATTSFVPSGPRYVVLTGNPNCGKTTIFNALTGLRAKVGNYAGVTVERKEGRLLGAPADMTVRVLDLPGTYSLSPQSLDEQVSRDVLLNRLTEVPPPSLIVIVIDASNLQRNLYYATQVIELGHPTVVALNMMDVAEQNGQRIDHQALAKELGVPVVPVVGSTGKGVPELKAEVLSVMKHPSPGALQTFSKLPPKVEDLVNGILTSLARHNPARNRQARAEALLLLASDGEKRELPERHTYPNEVLAVAADARQKLEKEAIDWRSLIIESRYQRVAQIQQAVSVQTTTPGETFSDKLDRVLTHRIWGTVIFLGLMALIFQSIFTLAQYPMDLMQSAVDGLGRLVNGWLPPGDLNSLLVDGVIAGVGAVVIFLPQILLLFLCIGFLEDTGYMARAAFIMDRVMSKVGLHGKSFIPMVSSFACAIPGIMATRTIESPRDRLVTILIAPLMSCSARLPVYTLLIAACIPDVTVLGVFKLAGLTMLSMYLLGVVAALGMAWIFKKTLLRGDAPLLILELPPYKRPVASLVLRHMWDRAVIFLKQAGTVILCINIVLWFLATYPRSGDVTRQYDARRAAVTATAPTSPSVEQKAATEAEIEALDTEEAGVRLSRSFAGRLGHAIEPFIAPLGFDWKIGIGIVTSFAAREVFVSTVSTIYNVGSDDDARMDGLVKTLKEQKRPNGTPLYTALTGVTLMVFYVFALQCVSTVAIVRRETNSWRWPIFQWLYLGVLAWVGAFLTWHIGQWLGLS